MALTNKLTAIGAAIREKTGKTELLTLDAMPAEILAITTGGGSAELPEGALLITGDARYMFYNNRLTWYLKEFGNRIAINNLTGAQSMFQEFTNLLDLPIKIHIVQGNIQNMFAQSGFETIADIDISTSGSGIQNAQSMFANTINLKKLPNISGFYITGNNIGVSQLIMGSKGLRQLADWVTHIYDKMSSTATMGSNTYSLYYGFANGCYILEEIPQLSVFPGTITANRFGNFCTQCCRLGKITFQTDANNNPIATKWANQTIDLGSGIGYVGENWIADSYITKDYISTSKEVTDDASYQALKNDPDWFTRLPAYSRYNHDSAVETINSLPDTSGGTAGNTIKLRGDSGSATDGGAINTLTDAEIAVAAAKGWTVTLQ